MSLLLFVSPEIIEIDDFGISRVLLRNFINSSLALPSTGGAFKVIFIESPYKPDIELFEAPGCTRLLKVNHPSFSVIGNKSFPIGHLLILLFSFSGFVLISSICSFEFKNSGRKLFELSWKHRALYKIFDRFS